MLNLKNLLRWDREVLDPHIDHLDLENNIMLSFDPPSSCIAKAAILIYHNRDQIEISKLWSPGNFALFILFDFYEPGKYQRRVWWRTPRGLLDPPSEYVQVERLLISHTPEKIFSFTPVSYSWGEAYISDLIFSHYISYKLHSRVLQLCNCFQFFTWIAWMTDFHSHILHKYLLTIKF